MLCGTYNLVLMVREQRYLTINGITCWKYRSAVGWRVHIPGQTKNMNLAWVTKVLVEQKLSHTDEAIQTCWVFLSEKKNNLPYYYNLFFSFLECRGFWLGYVTKQPLCMANLLRVNLSLPYFTHKTIKWPPTKEVKWLHPKMKSREIKVLYLNVCFPHRSLHWPVAEHVFFCQAVQSIWIKIACD